MTSRVRNSAPDAPPAAARWLAIVGIGADGVEGLSPAARAAVEGAAHVFGGARHLELARSLIAGAEHAWPSPIGAAIDEIVALRGAPVAVLASGDPNHFGVGAMLAKKVGADELECHPAPSSVSLAAARLGWPLQDTDTVSLCGRPLAGIVRYLQPGRRLLVLSADGDTPAAVAQCLVERGFGGSVLHVLEMLGAQSERIRRSRADSFDLAGIDPLNVMAIEPVPNAGARPLPLSNGLPDDFFETDGQLTKREVRAVTLSSLAPHPGELLWDIGTASGSIAIEWMLRHPANRAVGIEMREDRLAWARGNAEALGVPGLKTVLGKAPDVLAGLDAPDAVFIGGGITTEGLVERVWNELRPGGRLVANTVTLEGQAALISALERFGGELVRIGIERLDNLGAMHGLRPAMPVVQWKAVRS